MKKLFMIVLFAFIAIFTFIGCTPDTNTITSDITTIPAADTLTIRSINATDEIEDDVVELNIINKFNDYKLTKLSDTTSTDDVVTTDDTTTDDTTTIITTNTGDFGDIPIYITTINSAEWLIIYLDQPDSIIDQYIIQGVTINYPLGSGYENDQVKWQSSTTEFDDDPMSRKMSISSDGSKIYIPVTTTNTYGDFDYSVEKVEYLYDGQNLEASTDSNTIDTITMRNGIENKTLDNILDFTYYDYTNNTLNFDQIQDLTHQYCLETIVFESVYINNILVLENGTLLNDFEINSYIDISNDICNLTNNWISLKLSYIDGYGNLITSEYLVTSLLSNTLKVTNENQLDYIPRSFINTLNIELQNNITISEGFIPFNCKDLSIFGIRDDVVITFVGEEIILWNLTEEVILYDILISDVSLVILTETSIVKFINSSNSEGSFEIVPDIPAYIIFE